MSEQPVAPVPSADNGAPSPTSTHERPMTSGAGMVKSLAPMVIIDVVLPLITYFGLRAAGVGEFASYLISGIWPLLKLIVGAVRKGSIDAFSILILIFIVLGALTALVTGDVRTLLIRDSISTGGFGVVCLVTLLMTRPLMFYIRRAFATDGSPEGRAWWNSLWHYPGFRRSQRLITAMWGVAYVLEAIAHRAGLHDRRHRRRHPDHEHRTVRHPGRTDLRDDHDREEVTRGRRAPHRRGRCRERDVLNSADPRRPGSRRWALADVSRRRHLVDRP